jgi:general L-amino acid transport system substrate-binding protein
MGRSSITRMLVSLAAVALIGAGCSDDDDDGPVGSPSPTGGGTTTGDTVATGGTPADTGAGTTTAGTGDGTTTPGTGDEVQTGESVLDNVIANDVVRCGVRDDLPGFNSLDASGEQVGFDADFCRVIAAAVLGDATKVEFVPVETEQRFTALQSGEFDVLVRNTTWTASRDGVEGVTFLHPTYYDGQSMMVAADSGYTSIDDMDGAVVCVSGGTTSEGNVAAEFERRGLAIDVQSFENVDLLQEAFVADRCDGWSSDLSQLKGLRSVYPEAQGGPEALTIFEDEIFSKEPLAPAVIDGDSRWAQAVDWAIFATIQAEEYGITSENVEGFDAGTDVNLQRFLGLEVEGEDGAAPLDPGLDLPPDYAVQVVSQVGNYAEIFERNLAPLELERGLNALWNADPPGLQYAPPYR